MCYDEKLFSFSSILFDLQKNREVLSINYFEQILLTLWNLCHHLNGQQK